MFIVNIKKYYTRSSLILLFCMASLNMTYAQGDKKFIRKGNREFEKDKFSESEILYRKAADKNKTSPEAVFNIGDALYKQKKYEDAGKQFIDNVKISDDNRKKAAGMYNLGNSLLMSDKLQESIEAYKESLRLFPESPEAKYNLAYAQDLLKQQQQQQQQQNKDQNDKKKEDQDKNDRQDNNENKDQDQNKKQEQQDQQQSISKEDAQRLLNAIANDEKNVQEKVKQAKAAKERVRTVKNW